ncbi:MAG TPA: lipoprotein-releasing ABC transporter permease subunit [Gammaproteobacteria bacterium]|jgi:lipoprotein-releasing system permease protein|nr:lipoprotein-releasing ABC transporter permease subunit [Gammaproteobacteria bacterium]
MGIEFLISTKYLRSNQKKGFVSFISGASMVGLILGVMTLITVLSVMNGFHKELRDRILGSISHSYISEFGDKLDNWEDIRGYINENSKVIDSAPYIERYGLVYANNKSFGVSVRGVKPELEKNTSAVFSKVEQGKLEATESNMLIGYGLAQRLGISVGGTVILLTPEGSSTNNYVKPNYSKFTVSGIFDAGINEYDNSLAFIHLNQAQNIFSMDSEVTGIRLKLYDLFKAKEITSEIVAGLGSDKYYGIDWTVQKSNFIKALNLEKQMISIVLSLIIAVAAFNIVSMMVMVVTDKKADIAILRTIGMTPKRIIKIFFYQGLCIGLVGILIGVILGVALSYNIESVVSSIESLLGFQFFPKDVFYIDRFPSEVHIKDIFVVVAGAIGLVFLASIYPAIRAGKVNIAKVLSHE